MAECYDLAIIGGGPAGAVAARLAAERQLLTIVLEEHPEAGQPQHCGEFLSQHCQQRFGIKPKPQWSGRDLRGLALNFPDRSRREFREPGTCVLKPLLEQWLMEQALATGAEVWMKARVTSLTHTDDAWLLRTAEDEVQARMLIDASGSRTLTSELLAVPAPELQPGMQAQVPLDDRLKSDFVEYYVLPDLAPGSLLWVVPRGQGLANVGAVAADPSAVRRHLDAFLDFLKVPPGPDRVYLAGRLSVAGPPGPACANGLLVVGDAAGFANPLLGTGNHAAMRSAELAVTAAETALKAGDWSAEALAGYTRAWQREFPDYAALTAARQALLALNAEELALLGRHLPPDLAGMSGLARLLNQFRTGLRAGKLARRGYGEILGAFAHCAAARCGW